MLAGCWVVSMVDVMAASLDAVMAEQKAVVSVLRSVD